MTMAQIMQVSMWRCSSLPIWQIMALLCILARSSRHLPNRIYLRISPAPPISPQGYGREASSASMVNGNGTSADVKQTQNPVDAALEGAK